VSDQPARLFDPESSHETTRDLAANVTLRAQILDAAQRMPGAFDDRDLVDKIKAIYGTSPDRNIVAKARLLCEPSGAIVRCDQLISRPDRRRPTTHFKHWSKA